MSLKLYEELSILLFSSFEVSEMFEVQLMKWFQTLLLLFKVVIFCLDVQVSNN